MVANPVKCSSYFSINSRFLSADAARKGICFYSARAYDSFAAFTILQEHVYEVGINRFFSDFWEILKIYGNMSKSEHLKWAFRLRLRSRFHRSVAHG